MRGSAGADVCTGVDRRDRSVTSRAVFVCCVASLFDQLQVLRPGRPCLGGVSIITPPLLRTSPRPRRALRLGCSDWTEAGEGGVHTHGRVYIERGADRRVNAE